MISIENEFINYLVIDNTLEELNDIPTIMSFLVEDVELDKETAEWCLNEAIIRKLGVNVVKFER